MSLVQSNVTIVSISEIGECDFSDFSLMLR